MARETEIYQTPDEKYPENYGRVTVVVRDTETGRTATSSVDYDYFKSAGQAEAEALKDCHDKL